MTVIEEHEERLNKIEGKIDSINETTKGIASALGSIIKDKDAKKKIETPLGTINQRDWLGTLSIIVFTILQLGVMAWQLYSVMFGEKNLFLASLSVMAIPTIIVAGKAITGRDIKKSEVANELQKENLLKEFKAEKIIMQKVIEKNIGEIWSLKEEKGRLEERLGIKKETKKLPEVKLPPQE